METPKLYKMTSADIVTQALSLAKKYVTEPEWKGVADENEPGRVMINIFVRLMEILIERLNRIPEKNFLSFLDMNSVEQKPPSPAEVPVTFLLSKASQTGGEIQEGTQTATTQTGTALAQVFETRNSFFATPSQLKRVISLIPDTENYSELELPELPPNIEDLEDDSRAITAFSISEPSLQKIEHILYLGSESLFGKTETVDIELTFLLPGHQKDLFSPSNLEWKKYNKDLGDWQIIDIKEDAYETDVPNMPAAVKVLFKEFDATDEYEINGNEDYWIACHFTGSFREVQIPKIAAVTGVLAPVANQSISSIDAAFFNTTQIDLTKPFYPFGERPRYGDAFYLGSERAFSPDVNDVTMKFTILPYDDTKISEMFQNISNTKSDPKKVTTEVEWQYLDENNTWQSLRIRVKHILRIYKDAGQINIKHTLEINEEGEKTTIEGGSYNDGTFFGDGALRDIRFVLPIRNDIGLMEVNQQESYWIRALIVSSDPYGEDALFETTNDPNQPFIVIGPTFMPPIIEKAEIEINSYKTDQPIKVSSIQIKNNLAFIDLSDKTQSNAGVPFIPFIPITSHEVEANRDFFAKEQALYMGFDKSFGDVFISIFIHIKDIVSQETFPLETGLPQIVWEYVSKRNGSLQWKPLDIQDNTANFTGSGTVGFVGPNDSGKVKVFDLLTDEELYWCRARLKSGTYVHPPEILGIYLNTVMADHQATYPEDQIIGSGTGSADQKLSIIKHPVLSGYLWIKEAERPNEEELESHKKELEQDMDQELNTEDIIQADEGENGEEEIWVRWRKVTGFYLSGPRSRHYTLDRINGELTFGDGENGLLPPAGKDNIIMRDFQTGGGEDANSVASPLAVKELKSSLPYIDKAFNVQNAVGGSDYWSLEETMEFGPQSIKSRDRAVTTEDYEWMTLQQFSQLARARCLPTMAPADEGGLAFKPGAVTITVVPKSSDTMPQPSRGLIKLIKEYLKEKALGNIYDDDDIYVIGPGYKQIHMKTQVRASLPEESSIVEQRIRTELEAFFHPLTGGEEENGWDFGRDVYISEIYAVIERIDGVDHVESVEFTDYPGATNISIDDESLVAAGDIEIEMIT